MSNSTNFKNLTVRKQILLDLLDRLSLEEYINNNKALVNTAMPTLGDDYGSILTKLDKLFADNENLIDGIKSDIQVIEQTITQLGLELSDTPHYKTHFMGSDWKIGVTGVGYSESSEEILKTTIAKYVRWQYPSLQLHCRYNINRVSYMIASEPLYLAGDELCIFQDWLKDYPELYQRRVRCYEVIKDDFSRLPQNQFGFILSWDFFNLLSIDIVKIYIDKMLSLLRPGGTLMFSYNNAEFEHVAQSIDDQLLPWASKQYIKKLLLDAGYEIVQFVDIPVIEKSSYVSWVEAKRPGELSTIKRHPTMGEIKFK